MVLGLGISLYLILLSDMELFELNKYCEDYHFLNNRKESNDEGFQKIDPVEILMGF